MEVLRIYICGAHSTGKTTLLNDLKPHLKINFVEEVARNIIQKHNWKREDFLPDVHPSTFTQLNKEILQAQVNIEFENIESGKDFICDRGLDPIVYAEHYIGREAEEELYEVDGVKEWLQRSETLDEDSSGICFVSSSECISDDDVRLPPNIEDLNKFTERLENLLNKHGIMFHKIADLDREKRMDCILRIVKQHRPDLIVKNEGEL